MKTIFRFLGLALIVAAGAIAGFAQTPTPTPDPCADVDGQNALYTPFVEVAEKVRKKEPHILDDVEKAIEQGKSFLEKYGVCMDLKAQVDFVKGRIPRLEKRQAELILAAKYKRFDDAVHAKKWDEAFPAAKEVLAANPGDSHIVVALGLIGLDLTYQKNYKHSGQAIQNAKAAIALLKAGSIKPKANGGIGAWYECKPPECAGDLTFAIAHMTYWGKNDKTGALPYYYETTQVAGRDKDNPAIYEAIGAYYLDKAEPIAEEIKALIRKQEAAKTPEEKLEIENEEIKPKVALYNGYLERMIGAFGRAHNFTKDATRKAAINKELQRLYESRTGKTEGLGAFVDTATVKPLPNPASNVEPVVDPEPAKTETTTETSPTAPAAAPAAKPAITTPTKPVSTTGAKVSAASTSSAPPAETDAKKPTAKKKGTR